MPSLILPSRRRRQPQTVARLNPALEFAGFWLPSIGTINLVNSERGTLNGSATIQPRAGGEAFRLNGTGNTVTLIPTSSTLLPTTQGVTFVFAGRVLTTVANGDWGILNSGAPVGERCGCHFPFTDGTVYFDYGGATNGSTRVQVASLTFSESDVFVFSVGARGMEIWQNGILRASNAANPSRSASSSGWGLGGNNSDGASASPNAVWTGVGMTRRQLSSGICAQLSADLWGTAFVPDARRVYFGGAAAGPTAYEIDAQPGTFAVSGTAATLARGLYIDAQPGTYALTGTAATLEKTAAGAFTIDAQPGTFSISGTAATLAYGRKFDAQPGAFTLSGAAATLTKNAAQAFELNAQTGSFAIGGTAATLAYSGSSIWTDINRGSTSWTNLSPAASTWTNL